jgi:hypothetical protein
LYSQDTADPAKFATDPNVTTTSAKTFTRSFAIADILAVNGLPVMGTHTRAAIANIFHRSAPTPGQAIADTVPNGSRD